MADTYNHVIRYITAAGVVTTLAGLAGNSGSVDGTGSAARFSAPYGITTLSNGDMVVADMDNHAIRYITAAGVVTTVAGLKGTSGVADGTGTTARFLHPSGIAAVRMGIWWWPIGITMPFGTLQLLER